MKAQNKPMKTIITSNWRPLRRAVCSLLLGIAALRAMPRSARAQLYVSQVGNGANTGTVGTYDATTGAVINAKFITGVNDAGAIMLSGNTLFLANNGLFGTNGEVGTYNATTGAAINANLITGLTFPDAFALSGNDLFVATAATGLGVGKVGEYNATTGSVINATLITPLHPTPRTRVVGQQPLRVGQHVCWQRHGWRIRRHYGRRD